MEHIRPHIWQRQLHLFSHPFYYIEYGIARLGALQLLAARALEKGEKSAVGGVHAGPDAGREQAAAGA